MNTGGEQRRGAQTSVDCATLSFNAPSFVVLVLDKMEFQANNKNYGEDTQKETKKERNRSQFRRRHGSRGARPTNLRKSFNHTLTLGFFPDTHAFDIIALCR
jgi:hypothetical protein